MSEKLGNPVGQAPAAVDTTPDAVADYRQRLSRRENVVDPQTWALADPERLDRLQQPAAARLFRDRLCGCAAGTDYRAGHVPALSTRIKPVSRVLSIQVARSLHFLVLIWFLFFIVIHVTLVFTTGLLRNLNPTELRARRPAAAAQ